MSDTMNDHDGDYYSSEAWLVTCLSHYQLGLAFAASMPTTKPYKLHMNDTYAWRLEVELNPVWQSAGYAKRHELIASGKAHAKIITTLMYAHLDHGTTQP